MSSSGNLKKKSNKERINAFFNSLKDRYPKFSLEDLIISTCVAIIAIIAFVVRILPLRWGAYLSEFDPYYHYLCTEYVVANWRYVLSNNPIPSTGMPFWKWIDYQFWYPAGRDIWATTPPGLSFSGALFYFLLTFIGFHVSVAEACIFFPPVMGAITCIAIFFLAKDFGGKEAGLLAALILSVNAAYLSRTYLGFFKHETVGVFSIILIALFFLRSIEPEKSFSKCIYYSIAAGLSLAYLIVSWTAYLYSMDLIVLFVFALLLLRRYSSRILVSFSITMSIGILIGILVPRPGYGLLTSIGTIPVYGVFVLLAFSEIFNHTKTLKMKTIIVTFSLASLAVLLVLSRKVLNLGGKLSAVIDPLLRLQMPIVESVAEHLPATWASMYYEFGFLSVFALIGLFFIFKKPTNKNIYLALFAITAIYFATSYDRLDLILAPAFAILGAVAVMEISKPFIDIARGVSFFPKRKARLKTRVSPEFGVIPLILIFFLIFTTLVQGVQSAYQPVTIASSTIPTANYVGDWLEACAWLHDNTPQNSVVCCWWDYGYYVTVLGNRTTLADNSTLNTTQIANIGRIYMSNETVALPILKRYNVSYILVFTTLPIYVSSNYSSPVFYGDEVKWTWMAQIAGLNATQLQDPTVSQDLHLTSYGIYMPKNDTVFTELTLYGMFQDNVYQYGAAPPTNFNLVYVSSNGLVMIYQVVYPPGIS